MSDLPVFDDSYARALPGLVVPWQARPVRQPQVVALNDDLAADLGLHPEWLRTPEGVALLVGDVPAPVRPVAQAYAGHQFGQYSPLLGDGRALLVGELEVAGGRVDLHLKGSGRTPFARGGDGLAALGPMLREHLMGEAMHALGVPTTRALAVVATGESVQRERALPGAVLARVASSHLRVGTVQFAAARGDEAQLRALADYAIQRHHPQAAQAGNRYLGLFEAVVAAQADLVARWMLVGLVHGVMNTDNMTLSGETIDYGPCAMLDAYDPRAVFSSIDTGGRYAFGNQPGIAAWNLARLAEALLPLIDADEGAAVDAANEVLAGFAGRYLAAYHAGMAAKLGLVEPHPELGDALLELLHRHRVDYTSFFRALSAGTARELFTPPEAFDAWLARRVATHGPITAGTAAAMDRVNPVYVPRNHRVEEALAAATDGDLGPYQRLVGALTDPFTVRADLEDLAGPAPEHHPRHVTYCGT